MAHKHKAKAKDTTTTCWIYCVAASEADCDGSAHGGVTHREVCSCGAVRLTESNGGHLEKSDWEIPDGPGEVR